MNDFGEMSATGVVLSNSEMKERRLKRGECITCGIKCFKKTLFKSIPISDNGKVLDGRCLQCRPLDVNEMTVLPAQVEIASEKDLRRANSGLISLRSLGVSFRSLQEKTSQRNLRREERSTSTVTSTSIIAATVPKSDSDSPNIVTRDASSSQVHLSRQSKTNDSHPIVQSEINRDLQKCEDTLEASLHLERKFHGGKTKQLARTKKDDLMLSSSTPLNNQRGTRSLDIDGDNAVLDQDGESKVIQAIEQLADESTSLITILQVAQTFSHHFSIQEHATQSLCKFIMRTKLVDADMYALVKSGGTQLLISALKEHEKDEEILSSVSAALCHISTSKQIQISLADHDAVHHIVKCFDNFPDCENMLFSCIECLGDICQESANAYRLEHLGGENKIVETMASYSDSVDFQFICIDAIIKLSRDKSLRSALLAANGANQVSIAMIVFSNNLNLLGRALVALRSLSGGSSFNSQTVANSGAIDSIVSAMHLHRDNFLILSSAAWTLGDVGVDVDAARCIGECGGIDVITRALYAHAESQSVTNKSCRALEILSKYVGNHVLMIEIGVVIAVIQVIQHQTDQVSTLASCLEILSSLCRNNMEVKVKIVENETLDSISMLMVIHAEDRALQQSACSVLCNLVCDATLDSLLAIGVSELMTVASNKFPDECMEYANQIMALIEEI